MKEKAKITSQTKLDDGNLGLTGELDVQGQVVKRIMVISENFEGILRRQAQERGITFEEALLEVYSIIL